MINIVFDLSNMFHRSMFIVGGYGKKGYTFESQKEIDELVRKVAIDVSYTLRQVSASRVIFAIDSRSWRKDIEIEENEGYKAHRKKADHLDWNNIYSAMDDFCSIMDKKGLITSKIDGAEADDLMALWKEELLRKNQHVVLVSGDEDIRQLVDWKNEDSPFWSVVFNPFTHGKNKKKLYVPGLFEQWLKEDDGVGSIFNRDSNPEKESFINLVNDNQVEMETINGVEISLRKIFCGDDGDNVPAIYTWNKKTSKENNKQFRITESKYKKIKEAIYKNKMVPYLDYNELKTYSPVIKKSIEEISKSEIKINMRDRIQRQIKLVVLNSLVFPKEILEKFEENLENNLNKSPNLSGWHMNSLLEGTRYIDENYQRSKNEASIFKEIDKISQQLF